MSTMTNALQWPSILEREMVVSYEPMWGNGKSPPALDMSIQVRNTNGGGLWSSQFSKVQLRKVPHALAWQQMEVLIQGGLNVIDVPCLLCGQKPVPADSGSIVVSTVGVTLARALSMTIQADNAGPILPGMHFSYYDSVKYGWRMARVMNISPLPDPPPYRLIIDIWPPLRFGIADSQPLEWDRPRCVSRLPSSDAMKVSYDARKRADPSAWFIEAF